MKLYWYWSFNPQKAQLALEEIGQEYTLVEVDLSKRENNVNAFLELNPQGQVPVLDDDGFILSESMAILAYLGEKTGCHWPNELRERAQATRWLFFCATGLESHVGGMWFNEYVALRLGFGGRSEAVERGRKGLGAPMAYLNKHLAEEEYLCGEFTLADCGLGPVLAALELSSFDWGPFAHVHDYLDRLRRRPAWQRCKIDQPPLD